MHTLAEGVWGTVPTWLGVAGAALAFAVGLWQYAKAQRWKRSEFVAAEMQRFFANPRVSTALTLIDYSDLRLDGLGRMTPSREGQRIRDPDLVASLRDHTTFIDESEFFPPEQMVCREAFDEFLTGLETWDHFVEAGLVTIEDIRPYLEYWLVHLADPAQKWKDPAFYPALARFLKTYNYNGVLALLRRFDLERALMAPH